MMLKSYVYIAVALAVVLALGGAYIKGRSDGDMIAQANARKQLVEQLTERNKINENVSRMSAAGLCHQLGGVWNDGQCE